MLVGFKFPSKGETFNAMLKFISFISLLLVGGCIYTNSNEVNAPIVSPSFITNDVNDKDDSVLPPYTPWWVKE